MGIVKILFLSDTHLGFDFTFRPRVKRRRRGDDFFANYKKALKPALTNEVDLVVHGGDILYRSKVPAKLVEMAFDPLKEIADSGVPVYVVPGNHERSSIPFRILAENPNIFIFDDPETFLFEKHGAKIALSGFPFVRENIRKKFQGILEKTGFDDTDADCHLLCVHQCVEGASVGPVNYTFRYNHDVVKINEIPEKFTGVLAGHIHRFQVLKNDLKGKQVKVPVFFPGSIERTSFAEKDEKKGYLTFEMDTGKPEVKNWKFNELPARPMISVEMEITDISGENFKNWLSERLRSLPDDPVVKIKLTGKLNNDCLKILRAESLRAIIPESMNVNFVHPDYVNFRSIYKKNTPG